MIKVEVGMDYKFKKIDDIDVCFSSDWINELEEEKHFRYYHQQAKIVYDYCNRAESIIEIGVGSALLSDLLKRRGWKVATLDIDEGKNPDICASASGFDYSNAGVDVILAFEIFEHIPFSTFEKVMQALSLANVKKIYFSLPWNEVRLVDFKLELPIIKDVSFRLAIPRNKILTKAHFWELSKKKKELNGKRLVTRNDIARLFESHGYTLAGLGKVDYIEYFQAISVG